MSFVKMKKIIYIFSFTILGILLSFLVHAGIEILYLNLLISDFQNYSLGFSWAEWYMIHHVGSIVLFFGGVLFGLWQGKYWWVKLYESKIIHT